MKRIPNWYWPVSLVPAVVFAALIFGRLPGKRSIGKAMTDMAEDFALFMSIYSAVVLLGWLLMLCCGGYAPAAPADETAARRGTDRATRRRG